MDTLLKQAIYQLIENCEDIHQLTHIKLLLEAERKTAFIVEEPATQYGTPNIKKVQKEIAAMINDVDDNSFLQNIKNELDPDYVGSFENLSPEDRAELLELIAEPVGKDCISHEEFLKSMARWDTK